MDTMFICTLHCTVEFDLPNYWHPGCDFSLIFAFLDNFGIRIEIWIFSVFLFTKVYALRFKDNSFQFESQGLWWWSFYFIVNQSPNL